MDRGKSMAKDRLNELKKKIAAFPRQELIHRPTPLRRLDRLTAELGGPAIWIKRDDLTGMAFGGNKSRKLEFIIPDALRQGADTIITWASLQSNWCMQTATAARCVGLQPILILFKTPDQTPDYDGNLLLDYLLEADVRIQEAPKGKIVSEEHVRQVLEEAAGMVRKSGHRPYVVAVGGSMPGWSMTQPLGAIAYAEAFVEAFEQARQAGAVVTHVVHATGSGATQAGLVAGSKAAPVKIQVLGISVSEGKDILVPIVQKIGEETEKALSMDLRIAPSDIIVLDEYVKEGYGIVDRETAEAVRLLFQTEGIVLDPVYTGKAMAGLIDLAGKGRFRRDDAVLFFHTGGTPALFPYREPLVRLLGSEVSR
jgi:D-cysteine desulfhydrase family pyridoxal phosphate-dependent enzyme